MKKCLWLIPIAVAVLFSAAGCSTKGDVFLSFDWFVQPDDWSCTDTNIDDPGVIDTLEQSPYEYPTQPGNYYFDYTTNLNYWEIYYTLTAHTGSAFSQAPDAKFELFLWENEAPDLTQLQSLARGDSLQSLGLTPAPATSSTQTNAPRIDTSTLVQKSTYEYTVTEGGYTLKVRGVLWEPRQ